MLTGYNSLFGMLAGLFAFLGIGRYILTILRGSSRPKTSTWFIWSIVGLITIFSMYSTGSRDTLWTPIAYFICFFIVFFLSLYKQRGLYFDLFDKICIIMALGAVLVWAYTANALYALLISIFLDFVGALPTIRKLILKEGGEDFISWGLICIGNVFNVFAVSRFEFSELLYPVYMLKINVIIFVLIVLTKPQKVCDVVEFDAEKVKRD